MACENYYDNPAMDAKSFGAACTLIAVNRLSWQMHECGNKASAQTAAALYHALYDWIFTLAEDATSGLNTSAIYGFID